MMPHTPSFGQVGMHGRVRERPPHATKGLKPQPMLQVAYAETVSVLIHTCWWARAHDQQAFPIPIFRYKATIRAAKGIALPVRALSRAFSITRRANSA